MSPKCTLYCIIGDPVSHSLSPAMHNAAFAALKINAVYMPMRVKKEGLKSALDEMRTLGVKGINVTIPHKVEVLKYLDRLDDTAKRIGAVNTIVNKKGKLVGYNTDAIGAITAIKSKMKVLRGKTAVILGSGGAAKAIHFGLEKEGAKTIVLSRQEINQKKISSLIPRADLVCNCTPIGIRDEPSPIPKSLLKKDLVVFDAVYHEGGTNLANNAVKAGCTVITGDEMLVKQGAAAFELWTGRRPDSELMLKAVKAGLRDANHRPKKNIYLIGFMGTGKSSVGRSLAETLHMDFIDTDDEIEKKSGQSIKDIFKNQSEKRFRELEEDAVRSASKRANCVISVGGGAVLDNLNVYRMRDNGSVILLRAKSQAITKRLNGDRSRSLLRGQSDKALLARVKQLLEYREPYYDLAKDLEVETDNKSVEQVADEITRLLGDMA